MAKKLILSTGNSEQDEALLHETKGDALQNATSFEEAHERERVASANAGSTEPSRNALTDTPYIEGQVLTVVDDGEPDAEETTDSDDFARLAQTEKDAIAEREAKQEVGLKAYPTYNDRGEFKPIS